MYGVYRTIRKAPIFAPDLTVDRYLQGASMQVMPVAYIYLSKEKKKKKQKNKWEERYNEIIDKQILI